MDRLQHLECDQLFHPIEDMAKCSCSTFKLCTPQSGREEITLDLNFSKIPLVLMRVGLAACKRPLIHSQEI